MLMCAAAFLCGCRRTAFDSWILTCPFVQTRGSMSVACAEAALLFGPAPESAEKASRERDQVGAVNSIAERLHQDVEP